MNSIPYQKRKMLLQSKLKSLVDEGELGKARAVIEEAHAARIPGLNAQKFNWLVLAYVQAKQPEAAACFAERMEPEFGVKPSQRTFVHLVDGFAAAGDMESARAWYNKMQESGFDPDIRSLNNMIKACCRATAEDPDLSIAESWLQQVDRFGLQPDSHTYGNLIAGSARRQDVHAAVHWFDQMLSRGIEPCLEVCTMAFDAAAAAHADYLEVGKTFAESVFEIMRVANVPADNHCWNKFVRVVGQERADELQARE
jgi:pentatricopeptide repeat protein